VAARGRPAAEILHKDDTMSPNITPFCPSPSNFSAASSDLYSDEQDAHSVANIGDIMNPQSFTAMPPPQQNFTGWLMAILQQMMAMITSLCANGVGALPYGGTGDPLSCDGHDDPCAGGTETPHGAGHHDHGGNSPGGKPLGKNFTFQAAAGDTVRYTRDPIGHRQNVLQLQFNHGTYTQHSSSPRAELKVNQHLGEGASYGFKFGVLRKSNYDTTFFQILDHNGAKPAPRMWIAVKDGQYVLHLREEAGAGAAVHTYRLGKASLGKWDDIEVDFKRGLGNGRVQISINGKTVFSRAGIATMYSTRSGNAYPKVGQYRNQGDKSPGTLYISDFRLSGD
jgi:hypothetical protein